MAIALVLAGAFAVAFAAWGLATTPTPAESLPDDAAAEDAEGAVERFRLRLDRQAQLQAGGFVLITAGALVAVTPSPIVPRPRAVPPAVVVGLAASVLIGVARWVSIGAPQFSASWDRWLGIEGVAWAAWGIAFVVLLLRSPQDPAAMQKESEG